MNNQVIRHASFVALGLPCKAGKTTGPVLLPQLRARKALASGNPDSYRDTNALATAQGQQFYRLLSRSPCG